MVKETHLTNAIKPIASAEADYRIRVISIVTREHNRAVRYAVTNCDIKDGLNVTAQNQFIQLSF